MKPIYMGKRGIDDALVREYHDTFILDIESLIAKTGIKEEQGT